jgi:GNAT superfamily N-acetyltransferase
MLEKHLDIEGTTYRLAQVGRSGMAPLVPLFREVFARRDFNLDWLNGKYGCEYEGVRGCSYVAFTETGAAVASLGVLPWPMRFGDRIELAAQLVDAATLPQHRRRGLFARIAQMAVEVCHDAGISFLFAFPETQRHSYAGFIRHVGFSHIHDLIEYRLPIRTLCAERLARRAGPLNTLYERRLQKTLDVYTPGDPVLENSLLAEGYAGTHRNRAFHEYKSFAGSRVLEFDGGRVWLKVRRGVFVGDFEASSEANLVKTAHVLEHIARRLGIHQILFQTSGKTRLARFFAERYLALPRLTVVYRNLRSQIPVDALRFTSGDLDNF